MKSTGQRVVMYSYAEDGTVTVDVSGKYNLLTFERKAFGIDADDLEECDLPAPGEVVGTLLENDDQIKTYINSFRKEVVPNDREPTTSSG